MISRRTGLRVGIAAVVAGVAVGVLGYQWATADDFPDAKAQDAFCRTATPLDLKSASEMAIHDKHHVLEDLSELAPDGLHDDFGELLAWYEHFDPEDKEAALDASVVVGEFIERSCSEINIGGIRAADG